MSSNCKNAIKIIQSLGEATQGTYKSCQMPDLLGSTLIITSHLDKSWHRVGKHGR